MECQSWEHYWEMLTSCEVWCPTAGPPLSECSRAVIVAAWTPAAAGDCTPSEPHLKSPPTARWGYTHPAQEDKHTTGCEIFLTVTHGHSCVRWVHLVQVQRWENHASLIVPREQFHPIGAPRQRRDGTLVEADDIKTSQLQTQKENIWSHGS